MIIANRGNVTFKYLISPRQVTKVLCLTVTFLAILSSVGYIAQAIAPGLPGVDGFLKRFAINKEQTIPTFYSSLALFMASALLLVIGGYKRTVHERFATHWQVLGVIFSLMAVDETVGFHEMLSEPFQKMGFDGWLHNAWLVPAFFFLIILGIYFYKFFFYQPKYLQRLFFLSACLFLGGAMVTEMINGYYAYLFGKENLLFIFMATVEELGEMFGIVLFIHSLLTYINWMEIGQFSLEIDMKQSKRSQRVKSWQGIKPTKRA